MINKCEVNEKRHFRSPISFYGGFYFFYLEKEKQKRKKGRNNTQF